MYLKLNRNAWTDVNVVWHFLLWYLVSFSFYVLDQHHGTDCTIKFSTDADSEFTQWNDTKLVLAHMSVSMTFNQLRRSQTTTAYFQAASIRKQSWLTEEMIQGICMWLHTMGLLTFLATEIHRFVSNGQQLCTYFDTFHHVANMY